MCARAWAIPSVWAHNTFLSTLSNVWCSQMLNIRQWNELENIRTEHHSLSEYSMRARLSSPSTSPITLLAKSTRLPWRRISFQWITFISLIMHKVYLRHARTFTLSLVRTLKDANFHKSFSRLSYTAPSHIGIEKKRNESGNIEDSRVPLHNIFL